MPIYVGPTMWEFRQYVMGHMFPGGVSQIGRLHWMAAQMGLRREWFQDKRAEFPHYDITANKRAAAIRLGAVPLDDMEAEARIIELVLPRFRRYNVPD